MKESDWAWREIKVNDHTGVEFEPLTAPLTGDDWFFTVFSINTDQGFSMTPEPVIVRHHFTKDKLTNRTIFSQRATTEDGSRIVAAQPNYLGEM